MKLQEKQTYYESKHPRYRQANRHEKSRILDEYCKICCYQCKYAIRKLNQTFDHNKKKKPGRVSVCDLPEIIKVIRTIWFATEQMCGRCLVAVIPE